MPLPHVVAWWHKEVVNLSSVSDDDFILSPQNKKGKNRSVFNLSLSIRNTYAQIITQKKIILPKCQKRSTTTIVPTSQPSTTLFQHSTITTLW
jgi:hypothetical protein